MRPITTLQLEAHYGMRLPSDAYRWNRAMLGSFVKGARAYMTGEPIEACPYIDKRKQSGHLSWSRSFISAWRDGWKWAKKGLCRSTANQIGG